MDVQGGAGEGLPEDREGEAVTQPIYASVTGGSAGGSSGSAGSVKIWTDDGWFGGSSKKPADVVKAISAITAELPSIGKTDSGDGVKYKFRGIETLIGHLSGLLAKHGVVIVPRTKILEIFRNVENSQGQMKGWTETILQVTWDIYGPEGGHIQAVTVGIGRDNSDKGSNKAQTQAFKYLLMELFAIGDKDDDADGIPAGGRPEQKIDQATADMFVEHWKSIADNDIKLEVNRQLVALGDNKIHQLPASVLGQVASIILNAKEKDWKALK